MAIKKSSSSSEGKRDTDPNVAPDSAPKTTPDTVDGAAESVGGPPPSPPPKPAPEPKSKAPEVPYSVARGKSITSPRGVLANPNNQGEADEVTDKDFSADVLKGLIKKGYVVDNTAPGK